MSGTRQKADYYAAFSRFDTSNALPMDEYHSATSVANLGYAIAANTQARFTIRNADSAAGLPGAHDFYGISASGKESDQDIYSGLTLENRLDNGWHNLVRYGIARKREQEKQLGNVGMPVTFNFGTGPCGSSTADCFTEYFGNMVTIRGANGYTATGQASFFVPTDDMDSNRDELYYQSDYSLGRYLTALFGFRYENERGSYTSAFEDEKTQRTNFEYTLQLQGEVKSRVFYSAGGSVEKNHLYGITGAPRIGLAYQPVFPSERWMHGTRVRANVATGVQEPTLGIEFASLYQQLLQNGDTADIAKYHVTPPGPQDSRTYDIGVDQNVRGEKLMMKLGYFRSTFNHQLEGVDTGALEQVFHYSPAVAQEVFGPYLNSLAFRAQGLEFETQWQPTVRFVVRGGYTYLDAVVTQSFSERCVQQRRLQQQSEPAGDCDWCGGAADWGEAVPPAAAYGVLCGGVYGGEVCGGDEGRAGEPVGRFNVSGWVRYELWQLVGAAEPRPGLWVCEAGCEFYLCGEEAGDGIHASWTICWGSSISGRSGIRRCRLRCGLG